MLGNSIILNNLIITAILSGGGLLPPLFADRHEAKKLNRLITELINVATDTMTSEQPHCICIPFSFSLAVLYARSRTLVPRIGVFEPMPRCNKEWLLTTSITKKVPTCFACNEKISLSPV